MPGQHGIAAFYLCLEGGEREAERLAESAADPDLVPLRPGLWVHAHQRRDLPSYGFWL
jgi:hypothetical protein